MSTAVIDHRARRVSGMWAVTCYFNPCRYERRLQNYRTFRRRLAIPLLTIEWSADGRWQLAPEDADILVRRAGGDLLWQKERLLNVAIQHVPPHCDVVAVLDCDIVFKSPRWADDARERLNQDVVLLQPFREAIDLSADTDVDSIDVDGYPGKARCSFAHQYLTGRLNSEALRTWRIPGQQRTLCEGFAWVGRRDLLASHGLYDAAVIGGGGRDLACAAIGAFRELIEGRPKTEKQIAHVLRWALPFFESVRGKVSYVDGTVCHLWHGEIANRRYTTRQIDFARYRFDPFTDIVEGPPGCWRWATAKPDMHRFVSDYFEQRKEDG